MISLDELHDEYLSQPTDVLIKLRDDALEMIGDAEFGSDISFSESNICSFWREVSKEQRWIYEMCQRELVERGFETD